MLDILVSSSLIFHRPYQYSLISDIVYIYSSFTKMLGKNSQFGQKRDINKKNEEERDEIVV